MTYSVRVSGAARSDLATVVAWYASKESSLAARFEREANAAFDLLMQHPLAFPVIRKRVRRVNMQGFPYSIFYEMKQKEIFVLAIAHHSRYPHFGHH